VRFRESHDRRTESPRSRHSNTGPGLPWNDDSHAGSVGDHSKVSAPTRPASGRNRHKELTLLRKSWDVARARLMNTCRSSGSGPAASPPSKMTCATAFAMTSPRLGPWNLRRLSASTYVLLEQGTCLSEIRIGFRLCKDKSRLQYPARCARQGPTSPVLCRARCRFQAS